MTNTQTLTTTNPKAISQAEIDDLRETLADSTRTNTKRAYADGWADFVAFCVTIGADAERANVEIITRYIQHLKNTGKKLATIQARRAAISFHFGGRQNRDNPATSPEIAKLLAGVGNQLAKRGRAKPEQARPITLAELRALVDALPNNLAGKRDRAILLIGWFCAMRRSEIAALDIRDLQVRPDAITVTIQESKTTAVNESDVINIPRFSDDLAICPGCAVEAWLSASGLGTGPLFVRVDKWGHAGRARIHNNHIDNVIKRAAKLAKLPASEYKRISGHSLRAGLATELARGGASSWQIRQITRHKSDVMLNRYIREGGAATLATLRAAVQSSK